MYANAILGLVAQTSIHAGASSSEAAIDLPIQREGHTDWPVIFGSGMKGALRAHFSNTLAPAEVFTIFGPETTAAADHAGALLVSDARLLLLPVRSMTSHVKWVTCPALIKRFTKDLARLGLLKATVALPDIQADEALTPTANTALYLEEFRFNAKTTDLSTLLALLVQITGEQLEADLKQNLVVVADHQFRHLCRNAVPVQAHIAIETETKTVKNGALWYEENLPSETIMYCCLSATSGRNEAKQPAAALLGLLEKQFSQHNFLQVGGNLTTGMGWFEVNWVAEVKHG
jgi:CRISPR-associated protein Cmr4